MRGSQKRTHNLMASAIDDFTLTGRIAVVTGSASGIGFATAQALLQAGARVAINSRSGEKVQAALASLHDYGERALGVAADVSTAEGASKLMKRVKQTWGPADLLINNAGMARFHPVADTDEDLWDKQIRINLKSAYLCTRAVLPDMMQRGLGHIVMVNSVTAIKTFSHCAAYAAAKAGLLAFANVLREEVRGNNIRVTTVFAGATDTPLWDATGANFPRERMMSPEAVARAILSAIQNTGAMVEDIVIRPVGGDL